MKATYTCDYCGLVFRDLKECAEHEKLHKTKDEYEIVAVDYEKKYNEHDIKRDLPKSISIKCNDGRYVLYVPFDRAYKKG